MQKFYSLALLCLVLATRVSAQTNPVISSFSQNGILVCTKLEPGTVAVVEWASSLTGPWTNSWAGLEGIVVGTNASIEVNVPMFYRVRGTPVQPLAIKASVTTITIGEASSDTFTVRLSAQPAANVAVNLASQDTGACTVSPVAMTFTPANWSTPQQATVTGVHDADVADELVTVHLSSPGLTTQNVSVSVMDDDVLAIEASPTSVTVSENGTSVFQARLSAQPISTVNVSVASQNTAKATASPSAISFTPANWNTYQTVTASGVNDADAATENVDVSLSALGVIGRTVPVTVVDDDVQNIVLSTNALTLGESGSGSFTIRLAAQPVGNITVNLASQDTGACTIAPSAMIFTAANWSTPQTAAASGVDDADTADEIVMINVSSPALTTQTVSVTVMDDD